MLNDQPIGRLTIIYLWSGLKAELRSDLNGIIHTELSQLGVSVSIDFISKRQNSLFYKGNLQKLACIQLLTLVCLPALAVGLGFANGEDLDLRIPRLTITKLC